MITRGGRWLVAVLSVALIAAAAPADDAALLDAVRRGDVVAVRAALREGASPNAAQGDGMSALHLAADRGNLEVVRVLLEAKANVEAKTLIGEYTPVRIDTSAADFASTQPFQPVASGVRTFAAPLDDMGGISATFIELGAPGATFGYAGNYLLVLDGSCSIDGAALRKNMLVVATAVAPRSFEASASLMSWVETYRAPISRSRSALR